MSAYLVIEVSSWDAERFRTYEEQAVVVAQRHGGVPLVRDTSATPVERDAAPALAVVMRFPDKAAAGAFFDSPEYAPLRRLRQSISSASALIIGD